MSLIIPPGFLQAVYRLELDGDNEEMVTTCGHEIDGPSGANGADSPNDLFTAFANEVVPMLPSVYTLVAVDTYVGQDGSGPLVYTSSNAAVAGSNGANAVPQNTSFLIRKRTDLAGRRGRGRMYIPGVMEPDVDPAGNLSVAAVSAMQDQVDAWFDFLTAGVGARLYPPVVLHRTEGIGPEPLPTPVTRFVCEQRVATQRRRLRP